MRRLNIFMVFLIVAYMVGIWNFILMPKYLITLGLKGLLISLVLISLALVLIVLEMESTKRTKYRMYEFFVKSSRTPGVALTLILFLTVVLTVTAYYSSMALVEALNLAREYIILFGILTLLISALLLLMAKGKTLEFISIVSVLFIIFFLAAVIFIRNEAAAQITNESSIIYLKSTIESLKSFNHPITFSSILQILLITFTSLGMGVGFYYILGSFMPEELNTKKIIVGVVILQILLSFAAALAVAYSLGFAHQSYRASFTNLSEAPEKSLNLYKPFNALLKYTTNATAPVRDSIRAVYTIPLVLRMGGVEGASEIVLLLMLSIYFAGLTTIILLIEMGGQAASEVLQLGRRRGIFAVTIISILLLSLMHVEPLKAILLEIPFSIILLMAGIEALPIITTSKAFGEGTKNLAGVIGVMLFLLGLLELYFIFTRGALYTKLGAIVGLIFLIPVVFNSFLLKTRR